MESRPTLLSNDLLTYCVKSTFDLVIVVRSSVFPFLSTALEHRIRINRVVVLSDNFQERIVT